MAYKDSLGCFYADDGLLENDNHVKLQNDLDIMLNFFERVGLKENALKTKCMIMRKTKPPAPFSEDTYKRAYSKDSYITYVEWREHIPSVTCVGGRWSKGI